MSLSVIIPTIGRESLRATLDQVCSQLHDEDEVIVVADGPVVAARQMVRPLVGRFPVRYFEYGPTRCWGNAQRNLGIEEARGSHLYFLDDDDQSLPGGFHVIRRAIERQPERVHVFRMHHQGGLLWVEPEVRMGNVSTQMIVVPNDECVGQWPEVYAGDLYFLMDCLRNRGENSVEWHADVIAVHGISPKPETSQEP